MIVAFGCRRFLGLALPMYLYSLNEMGTPFSTLSFSTIAHHNSRRRMSHR